MQTFEKFVADRSQVLAFRLGSQNLASRLPAGSVLVAAGACGIQNTPPGSAVLALHARVKDLELSDFVYALEIDKSLLQMWSLRGAPYIFPTSEAAIFTQGVLPHDEESLRFFIAGAVPALKMVGMSAREAVERTGAELYHALDGREMTLTQLGVDLAQGVSQHLTPQQLVAWQSPSWYAPNQRLGEAIVHFTLHINALQGSFCFAPRRGSQAPFVRTDQWLGAPLLAKDHEQACAGLVRRYLRCYGPSTIDHFSQWAGIASAQALRTWRLIQPELVEIGFNGQTTWLHKNDLPHFISPSIPEGIRFLPPHDPYLQLRDRATLISNKTLQRRIWRAVGNPGIVIADGHPVALWRSHKRGKQLNLVIELLGKISQLVRSAIEAEAEMLAPLKQCKIVAVEFH